MINIKNIPNKILQKFNLKLVRCPDPYNMEVYDRLYSRDILNRRAFYNVGAGSFYHPYWRNIDYISEWYDKIQNDDVIHHDLTADSPLPIDSNFAEVIYTSHAIEHIDPESVFRFFREAYRSLRPGGVIRIVTGPDAETDFRAMQAGDKDWFYWNDDYARQGGYQHMFKNPPNSVPLEEQWLHHVASMLAPNDLSPSDRKFSADEIKSILNDKNMEEALDYLTGLCHFDPERPGNHMSWWTHSRIIDGLNACGFSKVYRSGYGQSVLPILRNTALFDATHHQISVYVEAVK